MLKSFWQLTMRFVALAILAITVTFSNPLLAQVTPSPKVTSPPATELQGTAKEQALPCPGDNAGSTKSDTGMPCEPVVKTNTPKSEGTYDMPAIKKFDRELYGD
jgi:hypothetical protein